MARRKKTPGRNRGSELPHPPGRLPLLGDVAELRGNRPFQRIVEEGRGLGPIFTRKVLGTEITVVSGADLVAELADEQRFSKKVAGALRGVRRFAGDGLFTADNHEPNWARAHDLLLPAFAMSSMRDYHPAMLSVANKLLARWDAAAPEGTVDVPGDMTRLTLDTIGLCGFGFDFESFERAEPHPFVEAMVRGLLHAQNRGRRLPGTARLYRKRDEQHERDIELMSEIVDEVIRERRASGDTSTDDLLGLMLNSDGGLDEVNIRYQVITFLIAGHETTSGALSFALHYLAKHPAVLARAQAEVDALWGEEDDPQPRYEDIGKLRYVRQVLNEALRLWPTAPGFTRAPVEDTVIGGRYPVAEGQPLLVSASLLHRDPVWGDNVDNFDPERFSPEQEKQRPPHAFKPFGTGERECIGRQFALHEATMVLGMLLHRYRLIDHARYQLRIKQTLTIKPAGLTLGLVHRTPRERRSSESRAEPARARRDRTEGRVAAGTPLTLLHGSDLGTSRSTAEQLASEAAKYGFTTSVGPLNEAVDDLPAEGPTVIVASSYNGKPTEDAAEFVSWLESAEQPVARDVPYAVLGVGDRNWVATYQRVPTLIDARLAEAGGQRLLDRGEVDVSGDALGDTDSFGDALWETLLQRYGHGESASRSSSAERPGYVVDELSPGVTAALDAQHGVVPMEVVDRDSLVDTEHPLARAKRFLRVRLPEGHSYRTGDHFAVLPDNRPDQVHRAVELLHLDPEAVIRVRAREGMRRPLPLDRPVRVRELFTHFVEVQDPATAQQIRALAEHNPCPPEEQALRRLAEAPTGESVLDLVEQHPALREHLPLAVLLELLPAMRPRDYSISSSAHYRPGEVDLMVSVLSAPARTGSGEFRGVGSHHLSSLAPGDTVRAAVRPCREVFRVVPDPDTPVIMIAAGTGLAPFRGFIADRRHALERGATLAPALCYFGCDHPDVDYLHREELTAAEEAGAVSMRPTFHKAPRDGVEFVQHRILAEADELHRLLESGARVYVCGDGARMAPGVREAFVELYSSRTGTDHDKARRWLDELIAADRYVEDVYAG